MPITTNGYGNFFYENQYDVWSLVRFSCSHPVYGAGQKAAIQGPELHMALPEIPSHYCACVKLW